MGVTEFLLMPLQFLELDGVSFLEMVGVTFVLSSFEALAVSSLVLKGDLVPVLDL
jgi:hypothetical protein